MLRVVPLLLVLALASPSGAATIAVHVGTGPVLFDESTNHLEREVLLTGFDPSLGSLEKVEVTTFPPNFAAVLTYDAASAPPESLFRVEFSFVTDSGTLIASGFGEDIAAGGPCDAGACTYFPGDIGQFTFVETDPEHFVSRDPIALTLTADFISPPGALTTSGGFADGVGLLVAYEFSPSVPEPSAAVLFAVAFGLASLRTARI